MRSNLDLTAPRSLSRAAERRPALLSRLRVSHKLALAALALGVPTVGLVALLASQQQRDIASAQLEQRGADTLGSLGAVQQHVEAFARQAHQDRLTGASSAAAANALAAQVNADLKRLAQQSADFPALGLDQNLKDFQTAWATFQQSAATDFPQQVVTRYVGLSQDSLMNLVGTVGNASKLVLDPELASSYTGSALLASLPVLRQAVGRSRLDVAWAIRNSSESDIGDSLRGAISAGRAQLASLGRALDFALQADPSLAPRLRPLVTALSDSAGQYFDALSAYEGSGGKSGLTAARLGQLSDAVQRDAVNLNAAALKSLDSLLTARVERVQRSRLQTLGIIALLLIAAGALLTLIARQITRPLGELAGAARRLAQGDLDASVPVRSADEIGVVAGTFNGAVAQLRENEARNEREREEAHKLQGHIGQFLDVTMDIAEGDLTRRGTVTEDVLGNVVDSINLMVEELAGVLREVQAASSSVNAGSRSLLATTDQVAQGAEQTSQGARQVSGQIQAVTQAIRQVAQSAQDSAQAAGLALSASQQGQQAVSDTLAGMQNIRREVQGVARRIKGLGERSLEIQEIVDTISRISSQTNLLALNAAIEAAGAGEAGGRFAIVADEVRKLADSSAQATGRIAALIKTVQAEIQEVTVSVEDGTREVEQGYRVAGTAGERLRDLGELARQSATLAGHISETTGQQVVRVEQASSAMQQIASLAEGSRASVEAGRVAAEQLGQLAGQLDTSLARFRLPS